MAGVRVTMVSFPGGGASPEVYDTLTFASPSAAIAGIANGFLSIAPTDPVGETEVGDTPPTTALNVTSIKSITQT